MAGQLCCLAPVLHGVSAVSLLDQSLFPCRLGQKGVDTASDNPKPVPSGVHTQDSGFDSTFVASVVAGMLVPSFGALIILLSQARCSCTI